MDREVERLWKDREPMERESTISRDQVPLVIVSIILHFLKGTSNQAAWAVKSIYVLGLYKDDVVKS